MAIRYVTRAGVGLVVGIIILAILVFAGLWFVRERGEQARRQEAINIADQQLKAESNQGVALTTDGANSSTESSSSGSSDSSTNTSDSSSSATSQTPAVATELPKTGAEAGPVFIVGIMTFVVFSYVRSRKLVLKKF